MDIERILAEIDAMSPGARQVVRAHLEVLEGGQPVAPVRRADTDEVRGTARELMTRFPEPLQKLANP